VVKLVDALDSKSSGLYAHASSILASGTNDIKGLAYASPFLLAASKWPFLAHFCHVYGRNMAEIFTGLFGAPFKFFPKPKRDEKDIFFLKEILKKSLNGLE
tara:strand:+ start:16408 stop:16710 length:303 start_codon:yes stop_codon:yes gene_type:complete